MNTDVAVYLDGKGDKSLIEALSKKADNFVSLYEKRTGFIHEEKREVLHSMLMVLIAESNCEQDEGSELSRLFAMTRSSHDPKIDYVKQHKDQ